jgi:hypothetical protein
MHHQLRTPSRLRAHAVAARLRATGAVAALTGLALVAVPLTANAAPPITFRVSIGDETGLAPLAGVDITVRAEDESVLATGVTGADGTVDLEVTGGPVSYLADAAWPGAPGDLLGTSNRTEFRLDTAAPVDLTLNGTHGTVAGSVTATAEGAPVPDLSGAALVVASAGQPVQRVALAADGSFTTGALPTTSSTDYTVSLVPPRGYDLAEQVTENAPFALPYGEVVPPVVVIDRAFALVPHAGTPTPSPTPEPTGTPDPPVTPAPTPPTDDPATGASPVPLGDAATLASALDGSTEAELDALLAATSAAGNGTVALSNGSGQVLGLAQQPTPQQAAQVTRLLAPVTAGMAGMTVTGIDLTAMDLETALLMVQRERASMLDAQLADQIAQVQARNAQIADVNNRLQAVNGYLAVAPQKREDGTVPVVDAASRARIDTAYAAAAEAVRGFLASDPFLTASADDDGRRQAAETAVTALKGQLDSLGNAQQMEMLRLQSLSDKRNEALDTMTDFVKKMRESRSTLIGSMRSTPMALGTAQWDGGAVSGTLDLAGVPNGGHHLILTFPEAGVAVVASVTVQRGRLAMSGARFTAGVTTGSALIALGVLAVVGASTLRRRELTAERA